jgi:photosystem I P700 chlorophyll a apoprotein A2
MIRPVSKSLHLQLSLALAGIGVITSHLAQHIYSLTHAGIFLIRDHVTTYQAPDVISRILAHKAGIISHLSWMCLWLGFHTLGLYIHNDTVSAFGEQEKQILIEPVFAQIIQESSGKALYSTSIFNIIESKSFDSF